MADTSGVCFVFQIRFDGHGDKRLIVNDEAAGPNNGFCTHASELEEGRNIHIHLC
jgi:hypothetical protein